MADKAKQGGKNRKFGRHARNPSSKLQAQRTARNKEKRIARHIKRMGGNPRAHPKFAQPCPARKSPLTKAA